METQTKDLTMLCSCHPMNTLSRFLLNYANQNAILLPGRRPGYHKMDIKLLHQVYHSMEFGSFM